MIMKKTFFVLSAAFVLFALASCQKEVDVNTTDKNTAISEHLGSIPFQLVANLPETKTTISTSTWAVDWEDTDIIYAVTTDAEWGAGDKDSDADGDNVVEFAYSGGVFSTATVISNAEHTFNFIYSGNAQKTFHRASATTNSLASTQSFDANAPTDNLKLYDALIGTKTVTTPASLETVTMSHLYTLMKVTLHNNTGSAISVNKFQISMPSGKYIAGVATVNFATPGFTLTSGQRNSITVNITNGDIPVDGDLDVYFVMAPVSSVTGNVTFSATTTSSATFSKVATVSGLTFSAGTHNSATFVLENDTEKDFLRINSLSDLTTGDYAIIGEQTASSYGFLEYGTLNSSRISFTTAYSSYAGLPSTVTTSNDDKVWTLTVSGTGDSRSVTMYNKKQKVYLKANAGISWVDAENKTTFTVTNEDDCFAFYGTDINYYFGVNKNSDFWRDYSNASTFTRTNGFILYKYWEPTPLSSIAVSSTTHPTEFYVDDAFSSTGLIVTASYENGKSRVVTPTSITPPDMSSTGTKPVTVSYTENAVTKETTYNITISPRPVFTVTLADTSDELTEVSTGAGVTLPSRDAVGLYAFYGWSETNVSSETTLEPTLVTIVGGKYYPAGNITLYPVYRKVEENVLTWTLVTDLSTVGAGTYALLTGDNHAFNGTITSGHGGVTTTTFSFNAAGKAYSTPTGTCEIVLAVSGSGFTMKKSSADEYLYATKAASGGLDWHNSEDEYWSYSTDWIYSKEYSGKYAHLRSYNNGSFRTYNNASNTALKMARKGTSNVTYYFSNPS